MTAAERYEEISKIQGVQVEIVRRVLTAERQSILDSLKRGEKATLLGRCVIKPEIHSGIEVSPTSAPRIRNWIKAKAVIAPALAQELHEYEEFVSGSDSESDELPEGIMLQTIESLS